MSRVFSERASCASLVDATNLSSSPRARGDRTKLRRIVNERKTNQVYFFSWISQLFGSTNLTTDQSTRRDVESDAQSDGFFRSMRRDPVPGAGATATRFRGRESPRWMTRIFFFFFYVSRARGGGDGAGVGRVGVGVGDRGGRRLVCRFFGRLKVTDGVLIAPLALIRLIDSSRAEARWISMSRITTCPAGSGARNGRRK